MPATLTKPKSTATKTMIPIRIYNTLSQQKEDFEPVVPGKVGIYLCGPTVYKEAHIGHLVGPIVFDTVKRFLTHCGYDVNLIVNLTDVDDKLIAQSQERGVSMSQVATEMTMDYCANLLAVGVDQISALPRATDHMNDIIAMIDDLIKKDYAYEVEGDVFFDVLRDKEYGKLNNRSAADQQGEGGGAAAKKRSAGDFALWKSAKPAEPSWESPWGEGRPGWHIECSAMSKRILGETFDIHGGGLDLKFPHHENEIAQSECCHDKPMAKYWMHNGLLRAGTSGKVGGKSDRGAENEHQTPEQAEAGKMSRSKGAGGLRGLIERQGGERLRFFLLRTHYRSTVVFSEDAVAEEGKSLDKFYQFFERYQRITGKPFYKQTNDERKLVVSAAPGEANKLRAAFIEKMADDFNTGAAIAELFQLLTTLNKFADAHDLEDAKGRDATKVEQFVASTEILRELTGILGLFSKAPAKAAGGDGDLPDQLMQLIIKLRADARANKDFAMADLIRDSLTDAGVVLEDRKDGTTWSAS
jgi:cysteinyl-tRNA synthetase